MQACLAKAGVARRRVRRRATPAAARRPASGGGGSRLGGQGGGQGGGRGGFFSTPAARVSAFRRGSSQFRTQFTTPQQTLQQVVNPPQTNIKSSSYSIGGVVASNPQIGVVTPSLVTRGRFIKGPGEALLASSYAARSKLKVGSKLDLNGTKPERRRARSPAAGRPDGRCVHPARPAAEARRAEGARQRPARAGRGRRLGRPGAAGDRGSDSRTRRSRARSRSRTRSAARSSTRRTSSTGSASHWRSWRRLRRSSSPRC